MSPQENLACYAANTSSQYGEDGIIAEIFQRIGIRSKCCVEFGAWDGKYLSNTWALWHEQGWAAILIEGEKDRHASLQADLAAFPGVRAVSAYVRPEGENSLDQILARESCPHDLDLLSIDVDGDEYHIWKSLSRFRPRVVIVEHNPTIPPELDLVQKPGEYFGASSGSLTRLAHEKGYRLVACTDTNSIFVADEDFPKLGMPEPDVRSIFPRTGLSYLINAYDGRIFMSQNPVYSRKIPVASVRLMKEELLDELLLKEARLGVPVEGDSLLTPVKVIETTPRGPKPPLLEQIWRQLSNKLLFNLRIVRFIQARQKAHQEFQKAIDQWKLAGKPCPPPHEVKQLVLRHYARRYRLRILVETGTYLGDMVAAMRRRFSCIYSIELGQELWQKACERFSSWPKIKILQGDSAVVLGQVMQEIKRPALFWLDGHYSAGITAKGELETPIFAELEHIFAHRLKNHVILIDDARCFDGTNDYPTIASLKEFVAKRSPGANVSVTDDIIRITP